MEESITNIITQKAGSKIAKMTETKAKQYTVMAYAGLRSSFYNCKLDELAEETGYTVSGLSKLIHKWNTLMQEGDVTAHIITRAYDVFLKKHPHHKKENIKPVPEFTNTATAEEETPQKQALHMPKVCQKPQNKKILGFIITPEDEMRERAAKRAAIRFFQTYGKGRQPRMNGEYFAPGTNPKDKPKDNSIWLTLEDAARYCGCKAEFIEKAGQREEIKRRVYNRRIYSESSSRCYYEYLIDDLDRFIVKNGLL